MDEYMTDADTAKPVKSDAQALQSYRNPMEAYEEWTRRGDGQSLAAVIASLSPTINAEIQRFQGPKPILRSKAKSLAVGAIKTYDPASGARLQSWVVTQLQPLSRYAKQLQPLRMPEVASRQAAEIARVKLELADELGHEPSIEELADATGLSVRRIGKLAAMSRPVISEGALSQPGSGDAEAAILPGVDSPRNLSTVEDAVYESLTPRDKAIFDMKTGKHGKTALSNQQIAARFGVTPALISQRTQAIATQIADLANRGVL